MEDIKEILTSLGYSLQDLGSEYRTKPIYREADNKSSLRIKKENGWWTDFGINKSGSFAELVKISLNLKDIKEAYNYLEKEHKYNPQNLKPSKPKLEKETIFDNDSASILVKDNSYWINRGISDDIISQFNGGICNEGKMKGRYVFPIYNSKNQIIGFSGRAVSGSPIKWKHLGQKTEWKYPLFINYKEIKERKEVILVESIGDCLSLFEVGLRNVIVTFGTEISNSLISTIIKLDPKKVYISLNNDSENGAGNIGSEKIQTRLIRYFDKRQLVIKLPTLKDFNEMLLDDKSSIVKWYENCSL